MDVLLMKGGVGVLAADGEAITADKVNYPQTRLPVCSFLIQRSQNNFSSFVGMFDTHKRGEGVGGGNASYRFSFL